MAVSKDGQQYRFVIPGISAADLSSCTGCREFATETSNRKRHATSPSPRSSRGEGWGEGLLPRIQLAESPPCICPLSKMCDGSD